MKRLAFAVAAVMACAGRAHGQLSVVEPKCFGWGFAPAYWSDQYMFRVVHVDIYHGGYVGTTWHDFRDLANNGPEWAALSVVKEIMEGRSVSPLQNPLSAPIALILKGIGEESASYDASGHVDDPQRFYRAGLVTDTTPGDRLISATAEATYFDADPSDGRSDKSYKHPLLINSGLVRDESTCTGLVASPMKDWMSRFCDRYKAIQDDPASYGLSATPTPPAPDRIFLDCEPIMSGPPGKNCVKMLELLVQSNRWSCMELPGDPSHRTAAAAYADMVTAHGWPANPLDALDGSKYPHEVLTSPKDPNGNRDLMAWWFEVCQAAQNAILEHAVYSEIERVWTATSGPYKTPLYGNYDDFGTDGGTDRTGWMLNPPPTFGSDCHPTPSTGTAVSSFPRYWMGRNYGSASWTTDTGVWVGFPSVSTGTLDQPFLYEISALSCWPTAIPSPTQFDLYDPAHPEEDNFGASLRFNRMITESQLNSFGGGDGRQARLTPWVMMATTGSPSGPAERYSTRKECRGILEMLRGKRVREMALWTDHGQGDASTDTAWAETQDALHRVWSARVSSYSRTFEAPVISPPHPTYNVTRLEHTLADDETITGGTRRAEVDLKGNPVAVPPGHTGYYKTELTVEFQYENTWPVVAATGYPLSGPHAADYFEINLECSTTASGTRGAIFLWDYTANSGAGAWTQVSTPDAWDSPTNQYVYTCGVASVSGRWEVRRRFNTSASPEDITTRFAKYDSGTGKWKSKLKLAHYNANSFWSYYDLVQLIPAYDGDGDEGGGGTSGRPGGLPADVDGDGFVDFFDMTAYIALWEAGAAGADRDGDGTVTAGDLAAFVAAFEEGA